MGRKLIIDGNAVYELDEECMLRKRLRREEEELEKRKKQEKKRQSGDIG